MTHRNQMTSLLGWARRLSHTQKNWLPVRCGNLGGIYLLKISHLLARSSAWNVNTGDPMGGKSFRNLRELSSEHVNSPFLNINALGRKAYFINLAINPIINQMLFSQSSVNRHSFTKCVLNANYKPVTVLNKPWRNKKSCFHSLRNLLSS